MQQKMAIFVLIIIQLPIAMTNVPSNSAQSDLKSVSARAETTSEPVYLFKIIVNSASDWTNMAIAGIDSFMEHLSVIAGANIPGFWYNYDNGYLTSAGASPEQPAVLEIDDLAFKGNQSVQFSISKGDNGYAEVTVYRFSGGSWLQLASFTNTGTNPEVPISNTRNFTVDYSQMYASPSSTATIELMPKTLKKMVFAFYYQWYFTPYGPGGETWHTDNPYEHQPLLGRYDSLDERIIEAHMRIAKAAGIDCFIPGMVTPGFKDERPLPAIFRIAESLNFKIALYETADRNLTEGDMVKELSYIVNTYSSYPAYLKVDGAPVIFVYCVNYNREPSYWTDVVRDLRTVAGPVYLVGDVRESAYAGAFDGLHWYFEKNTEEASRIYDSYKKSMRLGLNGIDWNQAIDLITQSKSLPLKERFLAFTVIPGVDMTKIGKTLYLNRRSGQTYQDFWQTALSKDPDGTLITSWNEWHEGTEIEPSVEYGFSYINLTRQYISLYKGTIQPTNSTALKVQTDFGDVMFHGARNVSLSLIDHSPSVQAVYVNLSISLSEGLNLIQVDHKGFYCYTEEIHSRTYNVVIPLLKPGEAIPFNITLAAFVGARNLNVTATGYSPSGAVATASTTNQFQVVQDRITVNSIAETTAPGLVSVIIELTFESDGRPVDNATVMVNGAPIAEISPGTFQITVTSWSPLYQFNITIEKPGFTTQNIALSGYVIGNITVEAGVAAILLAVLILLVRRRGR